MAEEDAAAIWPSSNEWRAEVPPIDMEFTLPALAPLTSQVSLLFFLDVFRELH